YNAAKEAGVSDEDAFNVMVANYFVGQADVIPIQNMLGRLNKITGNAIMDRVKIHGMGALEESIQEGIQGYLSNQIAKESYYPLRDPLFDVLEQAKTGGIVGAILPGFAALTRPKTRAEAAVNVAIGSVPVDPITAAQQDAQFEEIVNDNREETPTNS